LIAEEAEDNPDGKAPIVANARLVSTIIDPVTAQVVVATKDTENENRNGCLPDTSTTGGKWPTNAPITRATK
jgi:hypothetical protein